MSDYKCEDCGSEHMNRFSRPDECEDEGCSGHLEWFLKRPPTPHQYSMFSNADGSTISVKDMHMPGDRI